MADDTNPTPETTPTPAAAPAATGGADNALKTRLTTEFGFTAEQVAKLVAEGVNTESDLSLLSAAEIKQCSGCGLATAKKVAEAFKPAAPVASATPVANVASLEVLPSVPSDENWLTALKIGGVLKFNKETVVGTVSAALAAKLGLYELPEKIAAAMDEQAQSLEEPVGAEYFSMQVALTQRNYSEIFAAIPGATGRFATEKRKKELLAKINQHLWPALIGFHGQVSAWLDSWQKTMGNPAMMVTALASMAGGGGMLPPGMMQPPPTDPLRDSAEGVIQSINRIFAGTGIPVAMALAYDAQQIRKALENPNLPVQVGAANREQMLKKLGVAVTSDYPRLESSLKRYTLGVIDLPNVTPGQTELAYINALFMLGSTIQWDALGGVVDFGSGNPFVSGRKRAGIGVRD